MTVKTLEYLLHRDVESAKVISQNSTVICCLASFVVLKSRPLSLWRLEKKRKEY